MVFNCRSSLIGEILEMETRTQIHQHWQWKKPIDILYNTLDGASLTLLSLLREIMRGFQLNDVTILLAQY